MIVSHTDFRNNGEHWQVMTGKIKKGSQNAAHFFEFYQTYFLPFFFPKLVSTGAPMLVSIALASSA